VYIAGLLQPARGKIREGAKRTACKSSLRQIGIALHLYAEENHGRLPASLAELHPAYADSAKIFSCASNPSSWKDFEFGGKVTEKSSSYTYIPGLTLAMPGTFIVAHDKSLANHQQGRAVLLVNSEVVWWQTANEAQEAQFHRRLALQAEAVAKWRASGKPAEAIGEFMSPELKALLGG